MQPIWLSILLTLMTIATALPVYATEAAEFDDEGVLYGLEGMHSFTVSAQPGRVEVVNDVYRDSGASIRFHLMPGDCGATFNGDWNDCEQNNQRVDLSIDSPTNRSDEEYYTISMMLDANFALQEHKPSKDRFADVNLFQFYRSGSGACFNLFYNYGFRSLAIDNRCVDRQTYSHGTRRVLNLGLTEFNTWYDIMFHIRWSNDENGFLKFHVNGEEIAVYNGPTIIPSGVVRDIHPQMFIYRYGIEFEENTTPLTWWADNVGRYLSYSELPPRFRDHTEGPLQLND